ncbi:MAG: phosphodiester glycosidase family protein [Solirubrobacteraceae bacterium]
MRLALPDGAGTTLHVARWPLGRTRVRVVRMPAPMRLTDWCEQAGCPDAIVGGFYTRPGGVPLGELRIGGVALPSVPFAAPWPAVRACLHVGEDVSIGPREAFGANPPGDLLQAGPLLVRDGAPVCRDGDDAEGFSVSAHQFDSDITAGRHPRAALGAGGGWAIGAVCDGRADDDAGLTLAELAAAMAGLGAAAALNLDGGGSASLVCDRALRNSPRERHNVPVPGGRAIATAVAFFPR